ncbi:MAG TPA: hypothetical protein VKY90_19040 [Candidatus Dormibacteraeota bacterium]|nr:hypothetical protein [Candidatus Dormibacteraeota bacterium]
MVAWVAYLLLGSAVLGFVGFTWPPANASPVVANSQAFVAPVVAILLGRLLLAEPPPHTPWSQSHWARRRGPAGGGSGRGSSPAIEAELSEAA